jgi:hypothetical protein
MTITRENRRDNQEWTIEIYRQHWAQNIQRRQTQQNCETMCTVWMKGICGLFPLLISLCLYISRKG